MGDERDPGAGEAGDALPSVEEVARLDAFLDDLAAERRPASHDLSDQEVADRLMAAQLRLAREGAETPAPAFLSRLEAQVASAVAQEAGKSRRPRLSRGGFLRSLASLAGGAGLGVAAVETVNLAAEPQRPGTLVAADTGRWYDVAAVDEVQEGGIKPFSAGGVLGFLLNDGGRLHAVSAICTHMGCRLKPTDAQGTALHCLCHSSRFNRRGAVTQGLAPSPLPPIEVRVENGRVYALGTQETV